VSRIKLAKLDELRVGNLSAQRDWGYAPEYVGAMRRIASFIQPETFVIATGRSTSVRDFVRMAFAAASIDVEFEGEGLAEIGYEVKSGRKIVTVDPEHYRPIEAVPLVGNPEKARSLLGWEARVPIQEIIKEMVESDLAEALKTKDD
jgi:GDPmannose 4,6-dehydratase